MKMARIRTAVAKVFFILALVVGGATLGNIALTNQSVGAAGVCGVNSASTPFFGLRPWYAGLIGSNGRLCAPIATDAGGYLSGNEMHLSHFIMILAFNVADIVLGIIAYAAVFFVLYGGFNIVFSSGDPAKVAKGKTTISNALMGVAIALMSGAIVRFVNDTLVASGSGDIIVTPGPGGSTITVSPGGGDTGEMWANATSAMLMVAAFGAILMVAWGGVKYSMSAGDPQAVAKAKNTIVFALIGAVVMLLASLAVGLIFTTVTGEDPTFN
jgi:hypothetical protein